MENMQTEENIEVPQQQEEEQLTAPPPQQESQIPLENVEPLVEPGLMVQQLTEPDPTLNGGSTAVITGAGGDSGEVPMHKGNEEKKIFVGGISNETSNEDLLSYFSQFGEVTQAQVKYDRVTGRSRGFAFVEFATADICKTALASREQTIKGKRAEIKPAKSRENKKVFVGGLPSDFPEEELREHFEKFGKVEDIEWPFDRQRNAKRNFAFVVFEDDAGADMASAETKQTFGDRECDVKKAVPQGRRFGQMGGGRGRGRGGGYYGAGGGYGGMGFGSGGWGDWYGSGAGGQGYGNYYGTGTGYGGYGGSGGGYYDDVTSGYDTGAAYWWSQYGANASGYDSYGSTGTTGATQQQSLGGQTARGGTNRYQQHY